MIKAPEHPQDQERQRDLNEDGAAHQHDRQCQILEKELGPADFADKRAHVDSLCQWRFPRRRGGSSLIR